MAFNPVIFWGLLTFYGLVLYKLSPKAPTHQGFICIAIFSLIGVYAQIVQIETLGNAPAAIGRSLGISAMFMITVIMLSSAGSTLDSTFASISKSAAVDLPELLNKTLARPVPTAMIVMAAFAL